MVDAGAGFDCEGAKEQQNIQTTSKAVEGKGANNKQHQQKNGNEGYSRALILVLMR